MLKKKRIKIRFTAAAVFHNLKLFIFFEKKVFETLVNYRYLRNVEFILFLNKLDLLIEKIQRVDIRDYCHDYYGDPRSLLQVQQYLVKKFVSLRRRPDIQQSKRTAEQVYDRPRSEELPPLPQSLPDHGEIELQAFVTKTDNFSDNLSKEKEIYTHFTTAIDTNNIKTIFEMVRLMIFNKNCKAVMLN
jgi:hypothetical protein